MRAAWINQGDRTVSIGGSENEIFRMEFDVNFEDLVERPDSNQSGFD